MSQTKDLILAVLLGSFNFAVQAATLSFPEELIPITVNGKQVGHSLFSKKLDFDLPIGTHKVQIKYSDLYELDYDEHQTVSSAPFWVEVTITQDGQYRVAFDRAKDADAAEQFAKSPSVYVVAPNKSQQVAVKVKPKAVTAPAVVVATVQTASTPMAITTQTAPKSRKQIEGVTHPSAELMLHYWWQQADEKQREAFLKAVKVN
ncbi:DUF2057 family protein [Pseudoalteromonas phenolica]|uniref:DUF2057 family protein n=1 Tax=Pseudoalteromonas phenolica TaxID=161398 RepID=UPI001486183E|nr:DUF2057 family protein [Pseudoalteromonas phenolica]